MKETLQKALDALGPTPPDCCGCQAEWQIAITAIKEALAQPEHEPVGEIVDAIEGAFKCSFTKMLPVGTKLYTTPPQRTWVGLTDEDFYGQSELQVMAMKYAEAKLKEKNHG